MPTRMTEVTPERYSVILDEENGSKTIGTVVLNRTAGIPVWQYLRGHIPQGVFDSKEDAADQLAANYVTNRWDRSQKGKDRKP